jgi:hypothetical protein
MAGEEFIGTVDVWALRQLRWPLMRAMARRFVETRELCRYERTLLSSGRWSMVRCTPHPSELGSASHLFDVYGVPNAQAQLSSASLSREEFHPYTG